MLTGAVKMRLTRVLTEIVENHRRARAAVTEQVKGKFDNIFIRPIRDLLTFSVFFSSSIYSDG